MTGDSPIESLRDADAAMLAAPGHATVSLQGEGVSIDGKFAAMPCGGLHALGKCVVYQTDADGWKITIALEQLRSGDFALEQADGDNQVIATVSGRAGKHFVRKPHWAARSR